MLDNRFKIMTDKKQEPLLRVQFNGSEYVLLAAYESAQAELENLNRTLADERSGDCDKDKTIRRLTANAESAQIREKELQRQNKIMREALKWYADRCGSSDDLFCGEHPSDKKAHDALNEVENE